MKNNNDTGSEVFNSAELAEHMEECPDCSKQSDVIDQMLASLGDCRDAFCPPVEQLDEFARTGEDPSGRIAFHVEQCLTCQTELAEYREHLTKGEMPDRVRAIFELHLSKRPASALSHEQDGVLSRILRAMWLLLGTHGRSLAAVAAAAVLLVVLIYPRGEIETVIGLSSVNWEKAPGLSLMGPRISKSPRLSKPTVAAILLFKGLDKPLAQDKIDEFYQALNPNRNMRSKFKFVTPAQLKEAFSDKDRKLTDKKALAARLAERFNVDQVVFVTIQCQEDCCKIAEEVVDTHTGNALGQAQTQVGTEKEIAGKLRHTVFPLLSGKTVERHP